MRSALPQEPIWRGNERCFRVALTPVGTMQGSAAHHRIHPWGPVSGWRLLTAVTPTPRFHLLGELVGEGSGLGDTQLHAHTMASFLQS